MRPPDELAEEIVGRCRCLRAFTDRGMIDPDCPWCDHGLDVARAILTARIEGAEAMDPSATADAVLHRLRGEAAGRG